MKLNKKRKEQIEAWLDRGCIQSQCPFEKSQSLAPPPKYYLRPPCRICSRLFPEVKLKWNKDERAYHVFGCPCHILGIDEVKRRATTWVKKFEEYW